MRTSDLSKAVGVHPNTVRLYEKWGLLPTVPRSQSGYRLFTEKHLEQMRLARLALADPFPGRRIRRSAMALVRQAASGDLDGALAAAAQHLQLVRAELDQAQAAADYLEAWVGGRTDQHLASGQLSTSETAVLLDVTVDTLRHWERSGLLSVPRNPANNYRLYGTAEIGRLRVIRLLTRAGYSTMSVLRLLRQLDEGQRHDLRQVLDTPGPNEEIFYATDRWLSTLLAHEKRGPAIVDQLKSMTRQRL